MIFETISKIFRINTVNLYNMTLSGLHNGLKKIEANLEYTEKIGQSKKISDSF